MIIIHVLQDLISIFLNRYQQDHFLLALDDLFERYNPRVPKKLYNVNFVPISDEFETEFKPDNWIEVIKL